MKAFAEIAGKQLRTSVGKADSRKKLIGAVRAAASRLQLDDDDRRAIQQEETGKSSLADMTLGEIGKVLDRLNRDRPAPMAHRAHVAKIKALWWTLYWLGEIEEPNEAALDAFVRRQTGIQSLRFLDHRKAPSVIEALKAMAARAGVRWESDADLAGWNGFRRAQLKAPVRAVSDRLAVADAIWRRMYEAGKVVDPQWSGWACAALNIDSREVDGWTTHELDAAIRALGKRWRRLKAPRGTP